MQAGDGGGGLLVGVELHEGDAAGAACGCLFCLFVFLRGWVGGGGATMIDDDGIMYIYIFFQKTKNKQQHQD